MDKPNCELCGLKKEGVETFNFPDKEIQACGTCKTLYLSGRKHDWETVKSRFIYNEMSDAMLYMQSLEDLCDSPIERITYLYIYEFAKTQYGALTFEIQVPIGKYFADFLLIYQPDGRKLVIECDGHDYHERTKDQASHDKERDRYMVQEGYTVFRYTGADIVGNPGQIIADIKKFFNTKHYLPVWTNLTGHSLQ